MRDKKYPSVKRVKGNRKPHGRLNFSGEDSSANEYTKSCSTSRTGGRTPSLARNKYCGVKVHSHKSPVHPGRKAKAIQRQAVSAASAATLLALVAAAPKSPVRVRRGEGSVAQSAAPRREERLTSVQTATLRDRACGFRPAAPGFFSLAATGARANPGTHSSRRAAVVVVG